MTPKGANNAVIISSMVTLGSTTASSLTKGNGIHGKTVVGGFFAMAGCAVLTELNPDLGGYLAILVAGGVFVHYGLPLLENIFPGKKQKPAELTPKQAAEPGVGEGGPPFSPKLERERAQQLPKGTLRETPFGHSPFPTP